MTIYCPNCGASLPDGVAFCDSCGNPVRGQQQQTLVAQSSSYGPSHEAGTPYAASAQGATGSGAVSCPVCGAAALPGEAFCDNCGAALLPTYSNAPIQAPPSTLASQSAPVPQQTPPWTGSYAPAAPQQTASLVITNPAPPATLSVPDRPELIVGRSDPQSNSYPDVDLGPYGGLDMGVSRRHFRLSHTGNQFYIEDLNSINGTIINGQRIPPHNLHPIRPGDRIALGKMEVTFEIG